MCTIDKKVVTLALLMLTAVCCAAGRPVLVGHRGCSIGVENTAAAFRLGVDYYRYAGLECDVRVSKDGHYVISHDETTERVGGRLTVAEATLDELRGETYRQRRRDVEYTGSICTVDEFLDICLEKGVFPILELKWSRGINNQDMSNFDGLAKLIASKGLTDRAIILTSMRQSLEYIRTHHPQLPCQWLCNANWHGNEAWCAQWQLPPSISAGNFDAQTVSAFGQMGLDVACWTVDAVETYLQVAEMGVTMVTTNSLELNIDR